MSEIERYGATWQRFAGPGSSDWDVWLLMFEDQDRGNMVFGGKDYSPGEAERLAWEAWNRLSPAWNCHLFRLAELRPGRSQSERVSRLEEALMKTVEVDGGPWNVSGYSVRICFTDKRLGCEVMHLVKTLAFARSALNQSDGGGNG